MLCNATDVQLLQIWMAWVIVTLGSCKPTVIKYAVKDITVY